MAAFLSPVLIGRCDLNRYIIKSVSEMASTCELNAELIDADMLDRSFDISIIWDEIKWRKREENIIEKSLMPSETMRRGQTVHQTVSIPQGDFWTSWSVLNVQSKTLTSQKPLTQFAKPFTAATLVLPISQHSFLFELLWKITMMIFFTQDFWSCVVLYLN